MISTILGGVGLFLLGMLLMTDGLKALAGDSLRRVLTRFTGTPLTALVSGAAVTALVQSSSATTLTTIGFVSAGLLTFPQALGLIFGANVGTTSTGWLVALLGLKFSVSTVAMPVVGAGALLRLVARGRPASAGMALAGFGLIFIGIDALQAGMKGLADHVNPASFPQATAAGRVFLAAVGAGMTVVVQSSSAAVAITLAALDAGTISFSQAAALVVGQNVGTTVTAVIAAVGGSVPAKRTALAHVLFNVLTGVVALGLLPVFVQGAAALAARIGGHAGATSLAAFHTSFNLLGIAMFLPLTRPFAALIMRLVKERGPPLTRNLDRSTVGLPAIAVEAARRTAMEIGAAIAGALRELLRGEPEAGPLEAIDAAALAVVETRRYLGAVRSGPDPAVYERHVSTLHALDHLERLVEACKEVAPRETAVGDAEIRKIAWRLAEELAAAQAWLDGRKADDPTPSLERLSREIAETRRAGRAAIIGRTAASEIDPDRATLLLEGMRWIDRCAYHVWRAVHHLQPTRPTARAAPA
jgi:phosphate:Na+ symporter